ncbi:hypothetical protein E2C01_092112 [Portunus trituberculatus]|uniref:Uncharacterized protein n=1 Tax=Portunus trituberculatus TaxID=210409 RepID=A0A5B7JKR1_PORTR|nr:hypothetical protein [Portunus trituberculatus]
MGVFKVKGRAWLGVFPPRVYLCCGVTRLQYPGPGHTAAWDMGQGTAGQRDSGRAWRCCA